MEELKAASTESTAKSAQLEQELKQLREEKAETDEYLSEFEAASLAEGGTDDYPETVASMTGISNAND